MAILVKTLLYYGIGSLIAGVLWQVAQLTSQGLAPLISRLIRYSSGASPWRFEC